MNPSQNNNKKRNYYEILNVEKNSTASEIKKQYLKLAIILHPDKGGSESDFKELSEAYKILSDPEKRKLYDNYGTTGIRYEIPKTDPFEMFTNMFGMKNINPLDIHITLDLELSDLYNGSKKNITYEKNQPCTHCNGVGEIIKEIIICNNCRGNGKVVIEENDGISIHRIVINCSSCNGIGKFVKENQICTNCNATGMINEIINEDVKLPKGIPTSESILSKGKGHIHPNGTVGNLVINMNIREHHFFHRKGSILLMKKSISISDALCGFEFYLQHLDKHILKINIPHGKVISPNSVFKIKGEGMPIFGNDNYFGDLLVQFKVDFPKNVSLQKNQIDMLVSLFPGILAMKGKNIHYHREASIEEVNPEDNENKNNCVQQ